jgi:hypothetical protein
MQLSRDECFEILGNTSITTNTINITTITITFSIITITIIIT